MTRPRVPTIPGGAAFGAMAPMIRPVNRHGAGAERNAGNRNLSDRVAGRDGKKERQQRRGFKQRTNETSTSVHSHLALAAGIAELSSTRATSSGEGAERVGKLVVEAHGFPLECAHLMERQDLDPFDIFHRRDEPGDALDIGGIVGEAGHQHEADPDRLSELASRSANSRVGRNS